MDNSVNIWPKGYPLCLTSVSWCGNGVAGPHVHPQRFRERSSEFVYQTVLLTQCERLRISLPEEVVDLILRMFKPQFKDGEWKWKVDRELSLQLQMSKVRLKIVKQLLEAVMNFYSSLN